MLEKASIVEALVFYVNSKIIETKIHGLMFGFGLHGRIHKIELHDVYIWKILSLAA